MRSISNLCITMCLLPAISASVAVGQSNQEWTAYKQQCGIPAGMAYNDWVAAGSKCNSGGAAPSTGTGAGGLTPQQQMAMQTAQLGGYMIGQGLHNILFGQQKPVTAPLDPAAQQRALAAEQLNNSGIYLLKKDDYAGAINEFQKALDQAPNDANILFNLRLAKQRQKDAADAARTSNALGDLLGTIQGVPSNGPAGRSNNSLNLVNLDPNVVDFRGIRHTSSANPNSSFLNTVITGSDSNTVDLSSANRNYAPKLLEGQINSVLRNPGAAAAQISPQEQIDKLFRTPQSAQPAETTPSQPAGPGPNAPDTEQQTKAKVNALFSNPAPSPAGPHN